MERLLVTLEKKVLLGNVGRQEKEFLVCMMCPDGSIDAVSPCIDRDHIPILKKTLKKRLPEDDIKVLTNKTRRIE